MLLLLEAVPPADTQVPGSCCSFVPWSCPRCLPAGSRLCRPFFPQAGVGRTASGWSSVDKDVPPCAGRFGAAPIAAREKFQIVEEKKTFELPAVLKHRHPHSVSSSRSSSSSSTTAPAVLPALPIKMANINYLLYESAAGYAVFEVANQADSVGLQLKEVQNSLQNLATFSKHVKLVNFTPYR